MDELIKRRDALEAIAQLAIPSHIQRERILDALQKVPAADAVFAIRCQDCKHSREKTKRESDYLCEEIIICCHPEASDAAWNPVWPHHTCSYGERKTDG